jgi:photosystem II stability/assembly factor-like uncharacterized protein
MHLRPWKTVIALSVWGAVLMVISGCADKESISPNTPIIGLSATTLVYSSYAGSLPNPAAQIVTVTNTGVGDMTFAASSDCPWIETLLINDSEILITVRSETLATGSYEDTVTVTSTQAANSPTHIHILLTVKERIAVSPALLDFAALSGGDNPDSQIVQLTALGGTDVAYNAVSAPDWILIDSAAGTTPGSLVVKIDVSLLIGGIHRDSIIVTSSDLPNFRATIPVRVAVSSWSQRLPPPSGSEWSFVLRGVTFVDAQHGWASGYRPHSTWPEAVVCRTEDGGDTWEILNYLPNGVFEGLAFTDANTGWVAGDSARLMRTINGGDTWTMVNGLPIDSSISLVNLVFVGPDSGWIVGSFGAVLATTDSGDTWRRQNTPVSDDLSDLWFLDNQEGWVCGNHGTILHTTNGGASWTTQTAGTGADLRGICFTDAGYGWAVGENGAMLRTTNGGATWTALTGVTDGLLLDVFFVSATRGWVVGFGGLILQTTDGGNTWEQQLSGTDKAIFDIFFIDDNIGVVVGEAGIVLRTLSGGY